MFDAFLDLFLSSGTCGGIEPPADKENMKLGQETKLSYFLCTKMADFKKLVNVKVREGYVKLNAKPKCVHVLFSQRARKREAP